MSQIPNLAPMYTQMAQNQMQQGQSKDAQMNQMLMMLLAQMFQKKEKAEDRRFDLKKLNKEYELDSKKQQQKHGFTMAEQAQKGEMDKGVVAAGGVQTRLNEELKHKLSGEDRIDENKMLIKNAIFESLGNDPKAIDHVAISQQTSEIMKNVVRQNEALASTRALISSLAGKDASQEQMLKAFLQVKEVVTDGMPARMKGEERKFAEKVGESLGLELINGTGDFKGKLVETYGKLRPKQANILNMLLSNVQELPTDKYQQGVAATQLIEEQADWDRGVMGQEFGRGMPHGGGVEGPRPTGETVSQPATKSPKIPMADIIEAITGKNGIGEAGASGIIDTLEFAAGPLRDEMKAMQEAGDINSDRFKYLSSAVQSINQVQTKIMSIPGVSTLEQDHEMLGVLDEIMAVTPEDAQQGWLLNPKALKRVAFHNHFMRKHGGDELVRDLKQQALDEGWYEEVPPQEWDDLQMKAAQSEILMESDLNQEIAMEEYEGHSKLMMDLEKNVTNHLRGDQVQSRLSKYQLMLSELDHSVPGNEGMVNYLEGIIAPLQKEWDSNYRDMGEMPNVMEKVGKWKEKMTQWKLDKRERELQEAFQKNSLGLKEKYGQQQPGEQANAQQSPSTFVKRTITEYGEQKPQEQAAGVQQSTQQPAESPTESQTQGVA